MMNEYGKVLNRDPFNLPYFKTEFAKSMAESSIQDPHTLNYAVKDFSFSLVGITDNQSLRSNGSQPLNLGSNNSHYRQFNGETLEIKENERRRKDFAADSVEDAEPETLGLRKQCQNLVTDNRRLQMDQKLLQSKITTLEWQLKQTHTNQEMYRALLGQVAKYLEQVHASLEKINKSKASKMRASRSHSVHAVDSSKGNCSSGFPRAKSISQIENSDDCNSFQDFTWRRPRKPKPETERVPTERLSDEAFRLLRTVKSLLLVNEAELTTSDSNYSNRSSMASNGDSSSFAELSQAFNLNPPSGESDKSPSETRSDTKSPLRPFSPLMNSTAVKHNSLSSENIDFSLFKLNDNNIEGPATESNSSTLTRNNVDKFGCTRIEEEMPSSLTSGLESDFARTVHKQCFSSCYTPPLLKPKFTEVNGKGDNLKFATISSIKQLSTNNVCIENGFTSLGGAWRNRLRRIPSSEPRTANEKTENGFNMREDGWSAIENSVESNENEKRDCNNDNDSGFSSLGREWKHRRGKNGAKYAEIQRKDVPKTKASVSSNEDESGFSSMNSYQDMAQPGKDYNEVGIPVADCVPNHRRWNSTPVDTSCMFGESLKVLWV